METDGLHNLKDTKAKLDYLKELLTDRNLLANDPRAYLHVGKILEKEILRIRSALFATYGINPISDNDLPEPDGPKVNLHTKVYMPSDSSNSFNFVGRILGPDGSTAKCLQQCLGVKIMVRGRGSMRDRKKEEANIGKPNWEHLNDRLHVVLTVEDYENRAKARLAKASEYITLFLKESMKGSDKDDKVKQMQLMELSFRREPYPSWRFNCNNLLEMSFPHKPNPIFPNSATNFVNFGYAYPPSAPLFSPLHHTPLPHAHHSTPYGQQQHQHQPQNQSFGSHGMNRHGHLSTGYSHPYPNSLNPTAFLLGHSPNSCAGYASPFSPNSHAQTAAAASGLTVAPVSYWTGQGVHPLPADYAFTQPAQPNGHQATIGTYADEVALPNTFNPNGSPSSQNASNVYLPARVIPEDPMQQYVMTELGACTLERLGEFDAPNNGVVQHAMGLYSASADIQTSKSVGTSLSTGGTAVSMINGNCTAAAVTNGTTKTMHKRYSQTHTCPVAHRRQNVTSPSSVRGPVAGVGSRSTVVTVRIGSSDHRCSPPETTENGDLQQSDTNQFLPSLNPSEQIVNAGPTNGTVQSAYPVEQTATSDRPKLNTHVGSEKCGANKSGVAQAMAGSESREKLGTEKKNNDDDNDDDSDDDEDEGE